MKKLLALLLCVMLLASVIPTSAFAESDAYKAGSGLAGAYQARLDLFAALGQLATADALVNVYNGFVDLYNSGVLGPNAADEIYEELTDADSDDGFAAAAKEIIENLRKSNSGISYEDVFILIFPLIDDIYSDVGEELVEKDVVGAINEIKDVADSIVSVIADSFST